jgi:hypothetical protein
MASAAADHNGHSSDFDVFPFLYVIADQMVLEINAALIIKYKISAE